ncbi:hypothetical protein VTL71DRAFT_3175 [Oculimacula yallundae]|uniref:Cytochrome P450 n=1 Tax=Oculimacula yallundae TaxID=86028 RepID=A0ABR4C6C8_9HELO
MAPSFVHASGALLLLVVLSYLFSAFVTPLRKIPGPFLARFTGLYRLSMVSKGDAPLNYRAIHRKYGPIVRVGPNHVSISDPNMIPEIYGIGSKYLKTEFYTTMSVSYKGSDMHSMFSERDGPQAKRLKSQVAQLFSMTNMKNYEPHVDDCSAIFTLAMEQAAKKGEVVDLGKWLQWYAFDVIANISFQRKFGFMERKEDVDNMIEGLDIAQQYIKVIGQYPHLNKYVMGNKLVFYILSKIVTMKDVAALFIEITEDQLKLYKTDTNKQQRTDLLGQLRLKRDKSDSMTSRDEMNHLLATLLAGSDTTAITLRACFYYLIKTPTAYDKLVREIDEAHHQGQLSSMITFDEALQLNYLQAVLKEAMRMHPGVGFPLERHVPKGGAHLCGNFIPAGTIVGMVPPVIHENRDIFGADADIFRPERWIEATPEQLKSMDRTMLAESLYHKCYATSISNGHPPNPSGRHMLLGFGSSLVLMFDFI